MTAAFYFVVYGLSVLVFGFGLHLDNNRILSLDVILYSFEKIVLRRVIPTSLKNL